MRKLFIAASTLGVLAIGGIVNAQAQYLYEDRYDDPYADRVVEGRNIYAPRAYERAPDDYYDGYGYRYEGYGYRGPTYDTQWMVPGDAAILNQQRANQRSR